MKIVIMLRAIDEIDGPGIATTYLIDHLLAIDRINTYVLLYKTAQHLGRYAQHANVKEILVKAKSKIIYDQILTPWIAWRERADLVFNTKFSVPLCSAIPSISMQRGSEHLIFPHFYSKKDLWYMKISLPIYCKKARKVVSISDVLKQDIHRLMHVPLNKIHTIYSACHTRFKCIEDRNLLQAVRLRYQLPDEKYVVTVTKPYAALGSEGKNLYRGKNLEGILAVYKHLKQSLTSNIKWVFIGKGIREGLEKKFGAGFVRNEDFIFPGYVDQTDMPAIYSMARFLLFPSYYESFGLPIVEAMACGCPVITSNTGASPEIAADAGLTFDPDDIVGMTQAARELVTSDEKFNQLRLKGLSRAKVFTWERSAQQLLELFATTCPSQT